MVSVIFFRGTFLVLIDPIEVIFEVATINKSSNHITVPITNDGKFVKVDLLIFLESNF